MREDLLLLFTYINRQKAPTSLQNSPPPTASKTNNLNGNSAFCETTHEKILPWPTPLHAFISTLCCLSATSTVSNTVVFNLGRPQKYFAVGHRAVWFEKVVFAQ